MKLLPFRTRATPPLTPAGVMANNTTSYGHQPALLGPASQYLTTAFDTDVVPSEAGAYSIPGLWRGLQLISNGVALMMKSANVLNDQGVELSTPPLVKRPNRIYKPYEFWVEATNTAILHGNAIFIKADFDDNGIPRQVIPVHPGLVECRITEAGYPLYKIGEKYYTYDQLIHVRGFTTPQQWWGMGILDSLRTTVRGAIDTQNYGYNSFRSSGLPTVVIKLNTTNASVDDAKEVARQFMNAYGSGQRKPIAVGNDIDVNPVNWTPNDMQFLQAWGFNVAMVAMILGLDPSDLAATVSNGTATMTYSNIEQRNIERISSSFGPWLNRFEEAFSDALPDGQNIIGNPAALLRTDMATRLDAYEKGLTMGLWTTDYIQDKENIPEHYRPNKEVA